MKQSSPSRRSNSLSAEPKSSGKAKPECGESRTSGVRAAAGPWSTNDGADDEGVTDTA